MDFNSTIEYQSKTVPGASFRIRRLSLIERTKRDAAIAQHIDEHDDLMAELGELPAEDACSKDERRQRRKLLEAISRIQLAHLVPSTIRASLISISGLTTDGQEMTVDALLQYGDENLLGEVYAVCDRASRMTSEELKNWLRAGTSSAPETPQSPNINADSASGSDSTKPATADATSLAM